MRSIESADVEINDEIFDLIEEENLRQHSKIRLIASENYVSEAVRRATKSVLTNKYSEGYPGKRYYEGQQITDQVERIAQDRAMRLFGSEHANVQPYSGSPANLAIYLALLEPGDKVMGLSLPDGGHLTHGWNVSITGKWFQSVPYHVDSQTGRVDIDQVREIALAQRPKLVFCGGTAIPRVVDFEGFASVAKEIGAYVVADIAHISGLVAAGVHPSPVGHVDVVSSTTHKSLRGPRGGLLMAREHLGKIIDRAVFPGLQGGPHMHTIAGIAVALKEASTEGFRKYATQIVTNAAALANSLLAQDIDLVSGGTDNHLLLVDLRKFDVSGKQVAQLLDEIGIVCNYNSVPNDHRKPFNPSGIRLGTCAVTTKGMGEAEMEKIGSWIGEVVRSVASNDFTRVDKVKSQILELTLDFQ